ncbi:MAG: DUF2461 domain-containing protein [Candidatus Limimorpha sp.]
MEEVIGFLNQIVLNNNRQWFQEHKELYLSAHERFNAVAEKVLHGIQDFDESVRGLTMRDCTYRFYRDTRFSPDKSPYKRHFGLFVCPKGKKSGLAGYYFHLEGEGAGYLGQHCLFSGIYQCDPLLAKSIREDINSSGEEFCAAISRATGFVLDETCSYKKMPKGFNENHKYAKYLKLKDFCISTPIPDNILFSDNLADWVIEKFRSTYDFNAFLNRAALFALENDEK